ncbi:type I polyketide synthase [Dictyobacter formicarum]|uniref:Polyketide synthase n=1 Tax=Dictyobacter formicarum TaxID=2778368 RepID=A0ABQ3V979_9CHLR|nr:beta-ketoacyl synthase N-terminal-like domain-containing protein [Dictyobacter formicarum]GHO82465.1 polyketide synthase [Dictyobacter formicarum]
MQTTQQEPIAIIGIGCRFPGAKNPQAFWQMLQQGEEAISEVPAYRWNAEALYDPDPLQPGKIACKWGGLLEDIDQFDWRMFHIPPREARYMDPQHRLLLEVTWEALEDAGIPLGTVAGTQTSVAVGIDWNDYLRLQARNWSRLDGYTATGTPFAFASNRLSYFFDFKGPSISLDTACASSLTALHQACQSIWTGEATLALAGGVNLHLSPDSWIIASKTGLLSSTGRCRTLDASADGFVLGEGAGMVILKPLSLVQPTDRVYALIRSVAVNHNGHNEWIMATSQEAQENLLRQAYSKAGVNPAEVDYIELHGTGFLKGDAVEAKAIGNVVGLHPERKQQCFLGSVKTNIGHLGAASGIAGLIKVALSLYHQELPPTLNLQTVNPDIPLAELQLAPQRELTSWPARRKSQLLAGVSAQALTGTNAHAVLEGYNVAHVQTEVAHEKPQLRILPLSAASQPALLSLGISFKEMLTTTRSSWQNICYTASVRRNHHKYRLVLIASTTHEAAQILDEVLAHQSPNFTHELPGKFLFQAETTSAADTLIQQVQASNYARAVEDQSQMYSAQSIQSKQKPGEHTALLALGRLYILGYTIDWSVLSPQDSQCVSLPTYPWQRQRLWLDWLNNEDISTPPETRHMKRREQVFSQAEPKRPHLPGLETASSAQWPQLLFAYIKEELSNILEIDPAVVQESQSFVSLGIDSLTATQLINRLQQSLELRLPATAIFNHPSVGSLAHYLSHELLRQKHRKQEPDTHPTPHIAKIIHELSEPEVETLLTNKLTMIEEILNERP